MCKADGMASQLMCIRASAEHCCPGEEQAGFYERCRCSVCVRVQISAAALTHALASSSEITNTQSVFEPVYVQYTRG